MVATRSVRLLTPQYDAVLHDAVRDHSWQHPGLLAGTVGRAATQRTQGVTDTGEVAADAVGNVTPPAIPPLSSPRDEAASDPPSSDSNSSSGGDNEGVEADVLQSEVGGSAMSDERQAVPWSPSFDPSDVEDDPRGREAQS